MVRLTLHVLLTGVYVVLSSLTLLVQWESSDRTLRGLALLTLLGAWAVASLMVRTWPSLVAAAAGVLLLFALALSWGSFNYYVNFWILFVMVPLAACLWAMVAWRCFSEAAQTLHVGN